VNTTSDFKNAQSGSSTRAFHHSCLAVIETANDQRTIMQTVRGLRDRGFERVRVIDTGSSDATPLRARAAGAEVFHERRCGIGQACPHGLDNLPAGIAWVLFCNANASADLDDLDRLIAAAEKADVVIGNRADSGAGCGITGAIHRLGNRLVSKVIEYGWGFRFADFDSLRLVRREALDTLDMRRHGAGWNVVMQIRAVESRLNIVEVPVRYPALKGSCASLGGSVSAAARVASGMSQALGRLFFGAGATSATQPAYGATPQFAGE